MPTEDVVDLYENAPCGYLSMLPDGRIFKANATLGNWTGYARDDLAQKRFPDILTIATRIFYETHGAPMLRLNGRVDELALELKTTSGERVPVFITAVEQADGNGRSYTRMTLSKAVQRRRWERELMDARVTSERLLEAEMATAALREQFIAVLGHDLRNPIASIVAGMSLLRHRETLGPEGLRIAGLVEGSADRMSAIITDLLDFARGRLGGGASLNIRRHVNIKMLLTQVADELRTVSGRVIEIEITVDQPIDCDPSRLGQLVSNLLGNALVHGSKEAPVRLYAGVDGSDLVLHVCNEGQPIAPAILERLFQPFVRGLVRSNQGGLGLGLYIASEISRAHAGTLNVASSEQETRFTLRMPIQRSD